jgi:hypothetical protein
MTSHRRLSEAHQQTLLQIFQHNPTTIEWTDLVHLVEEVGEIAPKGDGTYRLVVNGEGHVLKRPHHDRITDPDDLAAIKTLFERGRVMP